ncbi:unnamed protein product [Rotaria socialis]|uniref:3CxxC-type domain-containing protein n=1 Tax=Rotaria socialis TaxID=392032 RepID=A0A818JH83_9BILA|nr:unnamed protein product [Rotaria socialis]CAF3536060.1 unnamed protein product [Rotaria socialis]CAF3695771.1 unnamed protein product [Rotaria socialis]CAF3706999.1 unnamed protein product [Rotaria socialis]CAF4179325.1 unnamed protein product [Rotaria socialis]
MEKFQNYPLSTATNSFILVDGTQKIPRFTSKDSGVSLGDDYDYSDNESTISDECDFDIDQNCFSLLNEQQTTPTTITKDAHMASMISDNDKKFFCENTAWAWHGEFGRLIMATAMTYNLDYRLILLEDRSICPRALEAHYSILRLDNAKAQFKCDTCGHCWTSMRARCSFYISKPSQGGIVLLKLYTQQCQYCYSTVYPLWYYDEICRVMKNLASTIFEHYFPYAFPSIYWELTHNGRKPVRRLLQREGNMHRKHNPFLCEACHLGVCYS